MRNIGNSGRNTKLLLHPKDVPDLQFTSKTKERGEISPEVDICMIKAIPKLDDTDVMGKSCKISPKKLSIESSIHAVNKFITDPMQNMKKSSEILPEVKAMGKIDEPNEKQTWFQNLTNCVHKWSKALKRGVAQSMGWNHDHTVVMNSEEDDKLDFSFFL